MRFLLNIYPPYLGAGVRVSYIRTDWRELHVSMALKWFNRNYVGTHFGGSLYSMVDPHLMLLLIQILGGEYRVWDKASDIEFIKACAKTPRRHETGTWITSEMAAAYLDLHRAGLAHSFETWQGERLVGGLYGVSLGRCFFGESMFSLVDHASKAALVDLVALVQAQNFHFIDNQFLTPHLEQFGVREISRREYLGCLERALKKPSLKTSWQDL